MRHGIATAGFDPCNISVGFNPSDISMGSNTRDFDLNVDFLSQWTVSDSRERRTNPSALC